MQLHDIQPDLVMCHIGQFLRMREYLTLSLTSKHFYNQLRFQTEMHNEQLLYISGNVNQIFFRQTGVTFFGSEEWESTFGIIIPADDCELLSMDTFRALRAPCPFNPDRLIKDTHALVYVPDTILTAAGREPVSFPVLGKLCPSILQDQDPEVWGGNLREVLLAEEQPPGAIIPDDEPGCPTYHAVHGLALIDCGLGSEMRVASPSWLLFHVGSDHGLVPGSRNLAFSQAVAMLGEVNRRLIDEGNVLGRNGEVLRGEGYEILSALEVAVIAALIYTKTGQRILPAEPPTFAVTKFIALGYNRTIIGNSNEHSGLFGFYAVGDDSDLGVCAARRLRSPPRSKTDVGI